MRPRFFDTIVAVAVAVVVAVAVAVAVGSIMINATTGFLDALFFCIQRKNGYLIV